MDIQETNWPEVGIVCPYCGNRGDMTGEWTRHASVPFKIQEHVIREWEFAATREAEGKVTILVDAETDEVDWESGSGERLECMQCYGDFEIPADATLDFEYFGG